MNNNGKKQIVKKKFFLNNLPITYILRNNTSLVEIAYIL